MLDPKVRRLTTLLASCITASQPELRELADWRKEEDVLHYRNWKCVSVETLDMKGFGYKPFVVLIFVFTLHVVFLEFSWQRNITGVKVGDCSFCCV
jgi:hypothetical protein